MRCCVRPRGLGRLSMRCRVRMGGRVRLRLRGSWRGGLRVSKRNTLRGTQRGTFVTEHLWARGNTQTQRPNPSHKPDGPTAQVTKERHLQPRNRRQIKRQRARAEPTQKAKSATPKPHINTVERQTRGQGRSQTAHQQFSITRTSRPGRTIHQPVRPKVAEFPPVTMPHNGLGKRHRTDAAAQGCNQGGDPSWQTRTRQRAAL